MVTQTINPLSAQRDLSKTGLKTTSIYRVDQDLFYVPKPTLNSALILLELRRRSSKNRRNFEELFVENKTRKFHILKIAI